MAYRKDPDLEFLGNVPSADLDALVRILTEDKDGDERLTEELTEHDSEISVFSNNAVRIRDGERLVLGANEVYVHDFATGEARSPWREAMRRHDVRTPRMGTATVFGDGGLMVEEHDFGRVLRLSADGALRWSYVNRASDGRVYRLGWSRYLDAEYGAEVARSVAAADCTDSGPQAGAVH